MFCVAVVYYVARGFAIIVCSALGASTVTGSVVIICSALGGSAMSFIRCSAISGATGVTSRMGVEEEGCFELAIELTNRSRTSDYRPCSSSNSSRTTVGVCVGGAKIVV